MRVLQVEQAGREPTTPAFLHWETSQRYRHALGFNQFFYQGLQEGVMRATGCGQCGKTFFPPRPFCPQEQAPTDWYDLPGTGQVVAATQVHSPPPWGGIEPPYVLAALRLDGVDGGITHRISGSEVPAHGQAVRAEFAPPPSEQSHPLLALSFAVEEAQ